MYVGCGALSQLYPQLHYWDADFFTLKIKILSFPGKNLEPRMAEPFANKRKKNIKPRLWIQNLDP